MNNKKTKVIFGTVTPLEIAKGVAREYKLRTKNKEKNGRYEDEISPIKMQKTLYFLYAFWIKRVATFQSEENHIEMADITTVDDLGNSILFKTKFWAWEYGPIIKEVYESKSEYLSYGDEDNIFNLIEMDSFTRAYIDLTLDLIFNTRDFALVDLSHKDRCWIDARNKGTDVEIDLETLKEEYIEKGKYTKK